MVKIIKDDYKYDREIDDYSEYNDDEENDDFDTILELLNNEENSYLSQLNHSKIKQIKNDLFQKLHFSPNTIKDLHKKLKNYIFIDNPNNIKNGRYIRWINLNNIADFNNIKLTNGGIICDIKNINDDLQIKCKNNTNHIFSLKLNNNLIFQKISTQEEIILTTLDIINN